MFYATHWSSTLLPDSIQVKSKPHFFDSFPKSFNTSPSPLTSPVQPLFLRCLMVGPGACSVAVQRISKAVYSWGSLAGGHWHSVTFYFAPTFSLWGSVCPCSFLVDIIYHSGWLASAQAASSTRSELSTLFTWCISRSSSNISYFCEDLVSPWNRSIPEILPHMVLTSVSRYSVNIFFTNIFKHSP